VLPPRRVPLTDPGEGEEGRRTTPPPRELSRADIGPSAFRLKDGFELRRDVADAERDYS